MRLILLLAVAAFLSFVAVTTIVTPTTQSTMIVNRVRENRPPPFPWPSAEPNWRPEKIGGIVVR